MIDDVAEGVRQLAGRYQLGELIGRGGMADVFLGTDSRLGRRVAIKLLKPALASDPAFRSRFRREAQDAAKMAHPTIVRIFDAGEESVRDSAGQETLVPFIVMEYVDGRMLKDVLADGPLEPTETARIIGQVLTALEYSHRAGVVHRDIKPGNVMITSGGQVKVMDFGIARAVSESSSTIAETSAIVGTAQYFSPEQARGEAVDARTDLYSTGVVLFELLAGRAPFTGANPVAVAYQHVNSEAVPPSSIRQKVSPAMDAVVLRSLAKDRFQRYQSASDFREDLEVAAAGEVPARKEVIPSSFNSTLFGVNPSAVAASEATLRRLSVDDGRTRTQNRPPVAWIWAGVVAMAAVIAAVVFWTFSLTPANIGANNSTEVPNVVGQTYEAGSKALEGAKLAPQQFPQVNDSVPEGSIIATDPQAGIKVGPGQQIKVFVSSGAAAAAVPDVTRQAEADAIAALTAAGLVYGATSADYSPDVPAGAVIGTDPPAGAGTGGKVTRKGDTVNLIVSNGLVNIPSTVGQALTEANTALSALQLNIRVTIDGSCGGQVVSAQSVSGEQPQKSAVTLRVCGG